MGAGRIDASMMMSDIKNVKTLIMGDINVYCGLGRTRMHGGRT
jgi:hypothetical protein